MNPRWPIAKRELRGVFMERTILLAIVIQVFVAGFSSFLVVGLSALVDPASLPGHAAPEVGVVTDDERLLDALTEAGAFPRVMTDSGAAFDAFDAGVVDALVLAPPPDGPDDPVHLQVVVPDGDLATTFTLVTLKNALEAYERVLRDERADRLTHEPLYLDAGAGGGSYAFVYGLLIPLLVFLPVVLAGALTADSLTEEVQRGTLPLLLVTPATPMHVVEGKLLANAALAPLLAVAWFVLLALNDLPVPVTGAAVILVLALATAVILGLLACAIALLTRDRNKAHVIYAAALMLLFALALALPMSPVNVVARLATGSMDAAVLSVVAATVATAAAGWLALRLALARWGGRIAAGQG